MGGWEAIDRLGEQASRMILEPQVGLLCVTCRVEGPGGGNMGKTTHPTARWHHPRERPRFGRGLAWSANLEPELAPPCGPPATSWPHCQHLNLLAKDSLALGPACPSTMLPSCWASCKELRRPFK